MFTSDGHATAARVEELRTYFEGAVLRDGTTVCPRLASCERSALFDGSGRQRPDVAFAAGQLPHVGRHYDLSEDDRPLRILIVGMETGRGDEGVDLDRRREQVAESTALAMTARNPHMQGVANALRLLLGRRIGIDRLGELVDLGSSVAHLFDVAALTNARLCSAYTAGTTESRSTPTMTRNCLSHLAATVAALEPTVCVLQGAPLAAAISPLVTSLRTVGTHVRLVRMGGVETFLAEFTHPTARGAQRWGGVSGVPYLQATVEPALRSIRQEIVGPVPDRRPGTTSGIPRTVGASARPAAAEPARPRAAEPSSRPQSAEPPPRPRAAETTAQVAERARSVVADEIAQRGGRVQRVAVGRRTELWATAPSGAVSQVRVVSRRAGDWQVSIREGDATGRAERFWAFVDLQTAEPTFFVVPDRDAVDGIRRRHAEYLARNGGRRVVNDASLHQAVRTRDVAQWSGRWDLLGLAGGQAQ